MTQLAPNTGPGFNRMKANLGPAKAEALRQDVLKEQTAAAIKKPAKPTKTTKAKTAKAKPDKAADTRKITVLAKSNPHVAGSRRARWFKQLKTGMTVAEAVKLGVRSVYLQRMAARKIILIGAGAVP
jgi:hypothetical protein